MLTPNARGYLLAVALFLACCWVNPNDAVPHRTRLRAEEQADQRVGHLTERSSRNIAHRAIGQPDLGADKKPALSGGGKHWRTSQRPRGPRSRNRNVNVNVNKNIFGSFDQSVVGSSKIGRLSKKVDAKPVASQDISKTSMEPLITESVNCTEGHNANDRYSSSFNGNTSAGSLNVSDDFKVAGEAGTKKTTSVHVGEDITLCWIETTTIKEDRSVNPVQRLVVREYTISFENSATIPERFLECVKLEGEIDGKNSSVPRSALFEVMDENTRHSRVVNFTTVSHSDDLTVWQHRRVRCGVGPVVTKNIIEWADGSLENPKKRVEIKVSPKMHRLTAEPSDTEPCTTDLVNPQLTPTTPLSPSSPVKCIPGITCDSYSDCVDDNCEQIATADAGLKNSKVREKATQSDVTLSVADEESEILTNANKDHESNEILANDATNVPLLASDEMIDSSKDDSGSTVIRKEVTTIGNSESGTEAFGFDEPSSRESDSELSLTLTAKPKTVIETGDQEAEVQATSEELNFSTSEMDESCGSGGSCADLASEGSTSFSEEWLNSGMQNTDTSNLGEGETIHSEESAAKPSIIPFSNQTSEVKTKHPIEDETHHLPTEEWETITKSSESEIWNPVTETIESNVEDSDEITETRESIPSSQCDPNSEECVESNEAAINEGRETTQKSLSVAGTTDESIASYGETISEATTTDISPEVTMPEIRFDLETTTEEITTGISEVTTPRTGLSGESITETITTPDVSPEVTMPEIKLGGETTTEGITATDISPAVTEPEFRLGLETTTEEITTDAINEATTSWTGFSDESTTESIATTNISPEVTMPEIRFGPETTTEIITTTDISPEVTAPEIRLGLETTTQEIVADISDEVTEIKASPATEEGQSELEVSSKSEGAEQNSTELYVGESGAGSGVETIESTTYTDDTGTAVTGKTDSNAPDSVEIIPESTTEGLTKTVSTATDVNGDAATHKVLQGSGETTTESAVRDDEESAADSPSSPTASCDEESEECVIDSSTLSKEACESGDCIVTSGNERYSTTGDSSETKCDNGEGGNCTIPSETRNSTDLPSTTSSTPVEVENVSTTVSDVPTTVESRRSTTVKAVPGVPSPKHKLALKIKILLEHIDDNQKKQKLVEVEKHLIFNEHVNQHDKQSLMKQVRSLNNTISMRTVQALFNCSTVEKLTGDVSEFAAKYLTLHDGIPSDEGRKGNFSSTDGLHMPKPKETSLTEELEADPNVELSLPGVHSDIHAGLSHVMTQVSSEHEVEQQPSEEEIPSSRLMEVIADPQDERVHVRRRRETMEDLTIGEQDLPKDIEEVGHWSNERVRRAIDGGHIRTLTEFTIYEGP